MTQSGQLQFGAAIQDVILNPALELSIGSCMKLSQLLAVAFWVSFVTMIVFETLFPRSWMNSSEYIFLTALFLSVLALGWVLADAKENDLDVPLLLNVCVVVAAFLAVPYYRFRYFGAKAGFVFIGIVAVNLAGLLFIAYALEYVSTGSGAT